MALIDERGRLFGKINIIDLAVVVFFVVLIPLAYAAFLLFRTPPPRLVAVSPSTVPYSRSVEQKIDVTGENLRPFLRAQVGAIDAKGFTALSPSKAELRFLNVPPGVYDVVLRDESQELMRLPKALTVAMPPIEIVGWLEPLPGEGSIAPGAAFGSPDKPVARIVSLAPDQTQGRTRAVVRAECPLSPAKECLVAATPVKAGAVLSLPIAGQPSPALLHVDSVRIAEDWQLVDVRLMGLPAALTQVREGDIDIHVDASAPAPPSAAGVLTGAIVKSLGPVLKNQGKFAITTSRPQLASEVVSYSSLETTMTVDAQVAQLLVPIESPSTRKYRDVEVRPGNIIPFETEHYKVQAIVLNVVGRDEGAASPVHQ